MSALLNLEVIELSTSTLKTFNDIRANRILVVDFWHTKCVKCPSALSKLNDEASHFRSSDVLFVSCALSQGEGNQEVVQDVVSDWENIQHVFMSFEVKEQAKVILGFTAVPFVAVIGKGGELLASGDPKTLDLPALIAANSQVTPAPLQFSLDEDF